MYFTEYNLLNYYKRPDISRDGLEFLSWPKKKQKKRRSTKQKKTKVL